MAAAANRDASEPTLELPAPDCGSADREKLEAVLAAGVQVAASDIHLHAGGPLKQRVCGELVVTEESIDPAFVERIVFSALTPEQRQTSLRAVIAWGEQHLPEEQRVGYIDKGHKEGDSCDDPAPEPLNWK